MSNYKLHSMYNFFVDGFVIHLMITPGAINDMPENSMVIRFNGGIYCRVNCSKFFKPTKVTSALNNNNNNRKRDQHFED
ncbi:MAG: hypothetical protein ACJAZ0_003121 [Halioglobus sp.]|jgi:hypothetical protein